MIIGQDKLMDQIDRFEHLPQALLFIGPKGSGKKSIAEYIAKKFNLDKIILDKINYDSLEEINNSINPTLVIIENLNNKESSTLLKFIEEPRKHIYVLILSTHDRILDTILNRCKVYYLEKYNKDFLYRFCDTEHRLPAFNDYLISIADTPGKILSWREEPIFEIKELCEKIFEVINKANPANVLTISNKLAFKSAGYNIDLFNEILLKTAFNNCLNSSLEYKLTSEQYRLTNKYYNDSQYNLNKQYLFEHYLFELRSIYGN